MIFFTFFVLSFCLCSVVGGYYLCVCCGVFVIYCGVLFISVAWWVYCIVRGFNVVFVCRCDYLAYLVYLSMGS